MKFDVMEEEVNKNQDILSSRLSELQQYKRNSEAHSQEITSLRQTNKELGEAIEAERAAHLESKFNSEIVQVRLSISSKIHKTSAVFSWNFSTIWIDFIA